ncbi:MAG: hypothetical protein Q9M19_02180 [Mariprofundaceae bacterium]|nr:hypothetical protein [Mariprofundaceae bacterium]
MFYGSGKSHESGKTLLKLNRLSVVLTLLLCAPLLLQHAVAAVSIHDVRMWTAPDHTRLVLTYRAV